MLLEVTAQAAQQVRYQAKQSRMEGMPLRIAAKRNPDGSLHYGMDMMIPVVMMIRQSILPVLMLSSRQ